MGGQLEGLDLLLQVVQFAKQPLHLRHHRLTGRHQLRSLQLDLAQPDELRRPRVGRCRGGPERRVTDAEARTAIDSMRARLATTAMCASALRISTSRIARLLKQHDPAKVLFACAAAQGRSVTQIAQQTGISVEVVRQMLTQQPVDVKQAIRHAELAVMIELE
ncbi:hypothetical protein [Geminicoccus flavidas]|uniref:hypothetical protein n=1 Tax=Geminicoccus flavidas TaxID=2506407 RepID=UPI00135CA839|nr:hypothetical protein [Geminicoccus flavidas]